MYVFFVSWHGQWSLMHSFEFSVAFPFLSWGQFFTIEDMCFRSLSFWKASTTTTKTQSSFGSFEQMTHFQCMCQYVSSFSRLTWTYFTLVGSSLFLQWRFFWSPSIPVQWLSSLTLQLTNHILVSWQWGQKYWTWQFTNQKCVKYGVEILFLYWTEIFKNCDLFIGG